MSSDNVAPDVTPSEPLGTTTAIVLATPRALSRRYVSPERAAKYRARSKSPATLKAYEADFRAFARWCVGVGASSLPAAPEMVGHYLSEMAEGVDPATGEVDPTKCKLPSTIGRALAGIAYAHRSAGFAWDNRVPEISEVMDGLRNQIGIAPKHRKKPLLIEEHLGPIIEKLDLTTLGGLRNHALLLLLFDSACRRSEVVALDVSDLEKTRDGYIVTVRRSKTDQAGEGLTKCLPYSSTAKLCAVRALEAWLAASALTSGPLFRGVTHDGRLGEERLGGHAVARIVKRAVKLIGVDPGPFSGHSGRAGFVTEATRRGKDVTEIMRQTGHRDGRTVAKYVRIANPFEKNAAVGLK